MVFPPDESFFASLLEIYQDLGVKEKARTRRRVVVA
jgi:hypothetical protein